MAAIGLALTTIFLEAVAVHPLILVTVTTYKVAGTAGYIERVEVVAPPVFALH